MNTEYQTINWNGLTLEISTRKDLLLSRITREEHTLLKATSGTNALIHDSFPAAIIRSAGGAADFVDVMLSAEQFVA